MNAQFRRGHPRDLPGSPLDTRLHHGHPHRHQAHPAPPIVPVGGGTGLGRRLRVGPELPRGGRWVQLRPSSSLVG